MEPKPHPQALWAVVVTHPHPTVNDVTFAKPRIFDSEGQAYRYRDEARAAFPTTIASIEVWRYLPEPAPIHAVDRVTTA